MSVLICSPEPMLPTSAKLPPRHFKLDRMADQNRKLGQLTSSDGLRNAQRVVNCMKIVFSIV